MMDEKEKMKQTRLLTACRLLVTAMAVLLTITAPGCVERDEQVEAGMRALADYGCRSCHTIPSIPLAGGVVGPPLDFWGSRWYIAGTLVNNPDNLVLWLMDPQQIEPGTVMPQMGVSEADARSMGAYLFRLRTGDRGHVSVRGHTGDALTHLDPDHTR